MTAANLESSLGQIFGHEGGLSLDRDDPGNWTGGSRGHGELHGTKYGIAANSYPKLDIRHLTLAQAADIYRRDYAAKIRFDDLPDGLDHAMLDFAINSGPRRAAEFLQRIVGVPDDGKIGRITLAEVREHDTRDLIDKLCNERLAFLRRLKTWPRYGKGWSRRVLSVHEFAVRLLDGSPT